MLFPKLPCSRVWHVVKFWSMTYKQSVEWEVELGGWGCGRRGRRREREKTKGKAALWSLAQLRDRTFYAFSLLEPEVPAASLDHGLRMEPTTRKWSKKLRAESLMTSWNCRIYSGLATSGLHLCERINSSAFIVICFVIVLFSSLYRKPNWLSLAQDPWLRPRLLKV